MGRPVTGGGRGSGDPGDVGGDAGTDAGGPPQGRRPLVERLGMAFIAVVLAIMFGGMAVAAWFGGELFLAVMAGIGALMTAWAGAITLFRG